MPKIPSSLEELLFLFRPCFTAPSFETFRALCVGFISRVGPRTITGCLKGARLQGVWHHSKAHRFFARASWSCDDIGLKLLNFVTERLIPTDGPLLLAIDDTLFIRSGRKVAGSFFHYDAAASNRSGKCSAWGNNWVVLGFVVRLPFMPKRSICLPLLFRLWRPGDKERTKPKLARELVELVAKRHRKREIQVVGDSAYATGAFAKLPPGVTLTARLRRGAALYELTPPRTGKRGRPRKKGERLPSLAEIADNPQTDWQRLKVRRYGKTARIEVHAFDCLWYEVFDSQPARVLLVRNRNRSEGFDVALVTTDPEPTPEQLISRYADRWSIEVCFQDAKQIVGVGEARNRTERAVSCTVPFGFICLTLVVTWYALYGHAPGDIADHRLNAPWCRTKAAPSVADMLAKLRRVIIATPFLPSPLHKPTCQEITAVTQAWAAAEL